MILHDVQQRRRRRPAERFRVKRKMIRDPTARWSSFPIVYSFAKPLRKEEKGQTCMGGVCVCV